MAESADWMDDPEAQAWARHVLKDLVPMVGGSALTVSLVPTGPADVKFAVELGMSIMLDKPVILVVQTGTKIPERLVRSPMRSSNRTVCSTPPPTPGCQPPSAGLLPGWTTAVEPRVGTRPVGC